LAEEEEEEEEEEGAGRLLEGTTYENERNNGMVMRAHGVILMEL
jgi:hypothetical protein